MQRGVLGVTAAGGQCLTRLKRFLRRVRESIVHSVEFIDCGAAATVLRGSRQVHVQGVG